MPQRIVPVRLSYTRPGGPRRLSSRRTFSVRGTDHDNAAASPGTEVVPSDWSVAIACCRSSGAGRDQKVSRTERAGPPMGRKTIVLTELGWQKWAPAERLSVSWTVPPRDAFRRYPRPSYVHRERLYSYRTLRKVTENGFRGPERSDLRSSATERLREPVVRRHTQKHSNAGPRISMDTDRRPAGRGDDRCPRRRDRGSGADPPGGSWESEAVRRTPAGEGR